MVTFGSAIIVIKTVLDSRCMVSACPNEADPRPLVAKFVSDPSVSIIPGLVSEGLYCLMDIVEAEVRKQYPDAKIVLLSKEIMIENRVMTTNDLKKYIASLDWSGVDFIIMRDDISIIRWTEAFAQLKGVPLTLFIGERGCRAVPMCRKLVRPFDDLD